VKLPQVEFRVPRSTETKRFVAQAALWTQNKVRPSVRKLIFVEYGAVFQRLREKFQ